MKSPFLRNPNPVVSALQFCTPDMGVLVFNGRGEFVRSYASKFGRSCFVTDPHATWGLRARGIVVASTEKLVRDFLIAPAV